MGIKLFFMLEMDGLSVIGNVDNFSEGCVWGFFCAFIESEEQVVFANFHLL